MKATLDFMIKTKYIILLFSLITTLGFSQSSLVTATTDTDSIRIGEQFIYKIAVDGTEKVIIPKLSLNGLEVVDSLQIDTINNKLIKKFVLTGFDSGAFYIPRQQIFVRNQAHLTDSILVKVNTIAVDTTKVKMFPNKAIQSEPYQFNDFRHLWWIALIVLAIIGFIVYWFFFRKPKEEVIVEQKPSLPPFELAMQSLQELDSKLLWQNNKIKEYYSELTEILRVYIEDELNVPALENTSDEIVKKLGRLHRKKQLIAPNESLNKLKNLLVTADLVKFAKSKPMQNEIETDRRDAEHIIGNLKPKIVEQNAE